MKHTIMHGLAKTIIRIMFFATLAGGIAIQYHYVKSDRLAVQPAEVAAEPESTSGTTIDLLTDLEPFYNNSGAAVVLFIISYFCIRELICIFIGVTPSPDVYYYIGFLLTITAIAISLSSLSEGNISYDDLTNYLHNIVSATGSAIWSTVAGMVLRYLKSREYTINKPLQPGETAAIRSSIFATLAKKFAQLIATELQKLIANKPTSPPSESGGQPPPPSDPDEPSSAGSVIRPTPPPHGPSFPGTGTVDEVATRYKDSLNGYRDK